MHGGKTWSHWGCYWQGSGWAEGRHGAREGHSRRSTFWSSFNKLYKKLSQSEEFFLHLSTKYSDVFSIHQVVAASGLRGLFSQLFTCFPCLFCGHPLDSIALRLFILSSLHSQCRVSVVQCWWSKQRKKSGGKRIICSRFEYNLSINLKRSRSHHESFLTLM